MDKASIAAAMVSLSDSGEQRLFMMIARDGRVQRRGSIPRVAQDGALYLGKTDEPLLDRALEWLPAELAESVGRYELPDRHGRRRCERRHGCLQKRRRRSGRAPRSP